MIVWSARVAIVAAVLLAVALAVQTWRLDRASRREVDARAAIQRAALESAGWQRAAEAGEAELARIVPPLRAEISALRRTNAHFAGASHWTGHGQPVAVPCPPIVAPPAGDPIVVPPGRPPTVSPGEPPAVAVVPHVRIEDAVALDDGGGVYVARHVEARMTVAESWSSAWEPLEPESAITRVDPRLSEAWKAYKNPPPRVAFVRSPKLWRFGLSCGIGLGYGVAARGVDVTAACVYGVEF